MSPRPLMVFDLDGTLVDSAGDLLGALDAVLPRHGYHAKIDDSFRDGVGHGARALIEYSLRRQGAVLEAPALEAVFNDFLAHYEANIDVHTRLYPGTAALLDRCTAAGWHFAVCTNKPVAMAKLLLGKLGFAARFDAITGGDSFSYRKPDARHLLDTIALAGGARETAILVGDSRVDLDTAQAAGVPFVGVTFGYTPVPMRDMTPDLLIDSYDDLTPAALGKLAPWSLPAATPA